MGFRGEQFDLLIVIRLIPTIPASAGNAEPYQSRVVVQFDSLSQWEKVGVSTWSGKLEINPPGFRPFGAPLHQSYYKPV